MFNGAIKLWTNFYNNLLGGEPDKDICTKPGGLHYTPEPIPQPPTAAQPQQEHGNMSIEKSITDLTAAVVALTAAITGAKAAAPTQPAAPTPAADTKPADKAQAGPATQQDALAAMNNLAAKKGRDVVVALLAKHGATKVSNMPPANYDAFTKEAGEQAAA